MITKGQKAGQEDFAEGHAPVTPSPAVPMLPGSWVEMSKKDRPELFSELDTLLRALDRFFYAVPAVSEKSYIEELSAARDVILKILGILEAAIPGANRNEYWFRKYAETKLLSERKRDLFREEMLKQDTPEKSLLVLYDSLISLKSVVTDLLKNRTLSYMSFNNAGQVISTRIRENAFFNPMRRTLHPEYDAIRNPGITDVVRDIKDKAVKKTVSVILLHLFRFLRYLSHVDYTSHGSVALNSSAVVLLLLKSEIASYLVFIEEVAKKVRNRRLQGLLRSVAYQFSMETKRVYLQEMKDIFERKTHLMRGRVENSHGILKNLAEQTVIQIVQFWKPEVKGEEIFESFLNRTELSMILREDIYMLERLIAMLIGPGSPEMRLRVFRALRRYIKHLESSTFRLIRYDDYEEFAAFIDALNGARTDAADFARFLERCEHFRIYLDTTLSHISHRAELKDRPIDALKVEKKIKLLAGLED